MRIRLDLGYDGTDFSGWARQPGLRTVQGDIEAALDRVLRLDDPARLTVAGRTDAGVHAHAQVAHLDLPEQVWLAAPGRSDRSPGEALATRLNAVLADDVVIRSVAAAPAGFDARFSAIWRRYAYTVLPGSAVPDPLRRREELRYPGELDLAALDRAAAVLVGERDFAPFCRKRPGATTIRTLEEFDWAARGERLVANVRADAFCHSMVRSLVGACLAVGSGRRDLDWLRGVAAGQERSSLVQVAPARGLAMVEVAYPPEARLAVRARQARAIRTLPRA
ncbi:tRNA pseudouridine(38-40) synthase TruA [Pseudactinotalea sp. HY158]|uniref:tRNA pseudouridine(38-40) synthase TruA n=1 Tax=Pseudactinotalea sp. HY158 TaxID=2654547 RepID=UPI00129C2231|nr:tRNA pseudouridine(38-40) synthase TruA [Pseudactinotalea sp. HY158]QGH70400.1 tRNA pseudouridine(38-40) synthase TruA [Pseudactinotalea sp. HY158]